jgi:DNA-binding NtrC family response regulator
MSTPHVLVVDDEDDIRALIKEILSDEGYEVTNAADAAEARAARDEGKFDLILLDIWMPDTDGISLLREWSEDGDLDCPVVIMSGHGTVDTAVEATRLGAFIEASKKQSSTARRLLPALMTPVGRSKLMQSLREKVQQYANHDSPVLLTGEAGTGRAAFARYIHALSDRAEGPLVNLLAASLTDNNAEEQLFGTEESGEVHNGYFERAKNGTLIIDELTDLNDLAQKLILSTLEQGEFVRRGGHEYESRIEAGSLRRELVSNLNTLSLRVPPLREYAEDVPELLSYYVDKLVDSEGLSFKRFGVAAQNRLRNYPWPDNVRELKNLVRRLLLTGAGEVISLDEVEKEIAKEIAAVAHADEPLVKQDLLSLPLREAREQFERAYLQQQLVLCDGKVGKLAKRVGMERTHLYRKLRSLGVDFRSVATED